MTKEALLALFEKYKGEILSGNELADQLGITRTSVWKAIKSLREEGYDIESIKKKGYRLQVNSDILSTIKIQSNLKEKSYDLRVFKRLDSTNKEAKLLTLTEEREWLVVMSEMQEAGRGQNKTSFISPEGKGVYMSVVMKPRIKLDCKETLVKFLTEGVVKGIREMSGITVEIKEGYHLIYNNKKIGGILSEGIVEIEANVLDTLVMGIGIYVYQDATCQRIENNYEVGSLSEIIGRYCNRSELIASILNNLYEGYNNFRKSEGI